MIIFGSKAVHLETIRPEHLVCPTCKTQGTVKTSEFRKHAHVFWLPLFPIGRQGLSQCQNCNSTLEPHNMPQSIKKEYVQLEQRAKGPLWQFTGSGLIVLLFMFSAYSSQNTKKLEIEYIKSPKVGDVYQYKITSSRYSTLKVVGVSADSIIVVPNEYEITKKTGMYKIDKPENYSDISYGLSRRDLKNMYRSREIIGIDR